MTSQGATLEEAKENTKEVVELYIESFGTGDLPCEVTGVYWTTVEVACV
ncbi:MAG: type II toxin-antitoxin system HicB family antitoxin [Methanosarcinaceae archaeon]